jgi:CDP-diacylglycerol--glycerol-3-phosphate 3-phosphatidyltransferase/cardiolipin synthase
MPVYRLQELVMVPSLISMTRVPLAFAFAWYVDWPVVAIALLAIAGLTDVLDGWYARRYGQVTVTGTVVDPITDKFFVLVVVVTLLLTRQLHISALVLLSMRELVELPLVAWFVLSPGARHARKKQPSANLPGKIATLLQFVSIGAVLLGSRHLPVLLWSTAIAGTGAGAIYWRKAIRGHAETAVNT